MILAAWNLNNRVGKVSFKQEAARAVGALRADVVVLTEYFPQPLHEAPFRDALRGGYSYYGHGGLRTEIDHLLVTERCAVRDARYLTAVGDLALADAKSALSDHAVLIADVHVR